MLLEKEKMLVSHNAFNSSLSQGHQAHDCGKWLIYVNIYLTDLCTQDHDESVQLSQEETQLSAPDLLPVHMCLDLGQL